MIEVTTETPTEQLTAELARLSEQERQPYLSEDRKVVIRRGIAIVSFELLNRDFHD